MHDELVSLGDPRWGAQTVLDHEAHVVAPDGRGVDPLHEALEGVVVGARQGDHELGHSSGPTSRASG